VPFSAYLAAPYIKVPTFTIIGRNDEMAHCRPEVTRATYELMRCSKQGVDIDGDHSSLLYFPGDIFAQAGAQQRAFLVRALRSWSISVPPLVCGERTDRRVQRVTLWAHRHNDHMPAGIPIEKSSERSKLRERSDEIVGWRNAGSVRRSHSLSPNGGRWGRLREASMARTHLTGAALSFVAALCHITS
jgi:hypothetical protein